MEFASAVRAARSSWECETTIADPQWPLRQLHALAAMLLSNRDELISGLSQHYAKSAILYERELAFLMNTIVDLILNFGKEETVHPQLKTRGKNTLQKKQPSGVWLIISHSDNPLQHVLIPFAHCIAARNTVVLAAKRIDTFFEILQSEFSKHLDRDSLHLVSLPDSAPSWTHFDRILICNSHAETWSQLPSSPHVSFSEPSASGYNVALLEGEKLPIQQVAAYIVRTARSSGLLYDGLDAVLVNERHYDELHEAIQAYFSESKSLIQNVEAAKGLEEMGKLIAASRTRGLLLLIMTSSLTYSIDVIRRFNPLRQLAFLNPQSDSELKFVSEWTRPKVFSWPFLRISPTMDFAPHTASTASIFSSHTLIARSSEQPLETIAEIRRSYRGKIPKLVPEHPGGRIDFFKQVEYAVKLGASVAGILVLVGTWYGTKKLRNLLA